MSAVGATGGLLVVAAVLSLGRAPLAATTDPWWRRLPRAYDTGRLAHRQRLALASAAVDMTPSRWALAQLLVALPIAVLLAGGVTGIPVTLGAALCGTRLLARLLLRLGRGRRAERAEDLAPRLARSLAAELALGVSPERAVVAAADAADGHADVLLSELLQRASAALALGSTVTAALEAGIAQVDDPERPSQSLRAVRTALPLATASGEGNRCLARLAALLEDGRRNRHTLAATTTEVRVAAIGVPVLAAGMAILLVQGSTPALAAALSPLGMAILSVCGATAGLGVLAVVRLTRW